MKHCPSCESQYADETLSFCLQDGTILTDGPKQSTIDTVAFTNPLTVEKFLQTEEMRVKFPDQTRKFKPYFVNPVRPAEKPKSSRVLWAAVLPMLLVLGAAGFGGWYYLNNQNQVATDKMFVSNPPEKTSTPNLPVAETVSEKINQPQTTNPDNSDVKKEITDFINSWKTSFESRKITEYTAKYADTVNYFDKDGTGIKEISSEVQKTFNSYTEIEIILSNIRVAVDADNDKATAVFDKEWSYETDKDLTEGKAHIKLQFQKIGNEWKIVSEKNLKTLYVEN